MPPLTTSPPLRPPLVPLPSPTAPATAQPQTVGSGLGFFLFLLVNAALFVRPADVVPELAGMEIYQYLILACFAVSFPSILAHLSPDKLGNRPVDLCVLFLLPAIGVSLLTRGMGELGGSCFAFFKILVYYLLFVSLVTTPRRLRIFTACLILFAVPVVILSALDFYKVIKLPRLTDSTGKFVQEKNRMYGPGIFQDPNDTCVLICTVMLLAIGRLMDRRSGPLRFFVWLPCLAVFGFGFILTGSRGGLLALLAGLGLMIRLRLGWQRAITLGILGLPLALLLLGGRQTDISSNTETGKLRVFLWSDGLVMFRSNPITGVGWQHYAEGAGQVAHNTYLHVLAETGILGGSAFVGATFLALWGLYRLARPVPGPNHQQSQIAITDPDVSQLYPYLSGAVMSHAVGMLSLSLQDVPTTYTMLGMASAFQMMATTRPALPPMRFDALMPLKFVGLSLLYLAAVFVFVRLMI